ncbi:hypothetical protein JAAARDRAFT_136302 [Jaapia argillacea MUCL 33604]|uniref:Hydrophobin n=1 Tax=Jaapia argillacea MUCL 33604 TaxID=933084 RepID=A0A067PJ17_9AGAM|nr:hypothetical protein JAAARDRAFT_136302 [Jaapia argillacea MUCL 33604]
MRFSIAPTIVSLVTLCLSSLDLLPGAHALPRGGLRHYRPVRRTSGSLLDICAYIDGDVIGSLSILGINLNALVDLQICLCLSALPLALESNIQIQSLVQTYGASVVSDILVDLIHSSPSSQQCPHPPPNAKALCSSGNVCDFQCNSPYVRQGQTCGCAPPNIMCNGVCAPSSRGCGSAVPRSLGARAQNSLGIKTFSQAQAYCDSAAGVNQMVCGAPSGVLGFECLNVKTHLESCTFPSGPLISCF